MQDKFKPYISGNENASEFTISSVVWGILFSIIFCAANAYLGLRSGLTISAGIPISILSVGIYKSIKKKNFVLECNMIQSIGSVGESLDQGLIFSLPALFMWAKENNIDLPSINYVFLLPIIEKRSMSMTKEGIRQEKRLMLVTNVKGIIIVLPFECYLQCWMIITTT